MSFHRLLRPGSWPRQLVVTICFFGLMAPDVVALELVSEMGGELYVDPIAPNESCLAGDLSDDSGIVAKLATPPLKPGRYVANSQIRVSHNTGKSFARLKFTITATANGQPLATTDQTILAFAEPNTYRVFPLAFVVTEDQQEVDLQIGWHWAGRQDEKRTVPIDKMPEAGGAELSSNNSETLVLERHLRDLPFHVAVSTVSLEHQGTAFIENVRPDKIRYRPGEPFTAQVDVRNLDANAKELTLVTELVNGFDRVLPIQQTVVKLDANAEQKVQVATVLNDVLWGYEVRARLIDGGNVIDERSDYFTVHNNPWAVAIGAYSINLPYYCAGPDGTKAPYRAAHIRKNYANIVEFGFWAPDDMGDLNPEETPYFSGQMRRESGAESLHFIIDAMHREGIACSYYTRLRVAGGKAGYERFRQHPDLFEPEFYDVDHFDRWETAKALISWPRVAARARAKAAYLHHADEIIRSVQRFKWDAARYDTDMTLREEDGYAYAVEMFPLVRARVDNALGPGHFWGFNDGLHRMDLSKEPAFTKLYEELCRGGGMIMDEYNNHAFKDGWSYDRYTARHLTMRRITHPLGGHVVFCPGEGEWVDLVYQAFLPLVAGAHQAWDVTKGYPPYVNYNPFATRFAAYLWDNTARPLTTAKTRVNWHDAAKQLYRWSDYVTVRKREDGGDLILHMVNHPQEQVNVSLDGPVPEPLKDVPCAITLPPDTQVKAVWLATAEPELRYAKLGHQIDGARLSFTVPYLRFWNICVVEWTGKGAWQ